MKRQNFLFLYESIFANANGDPNNGNRPRVDSETGRQLVTDFRYKRTVRDFLKVQAIMNPADETNRILYQHHFKEEGNQMSGVKTLKDTLESYFKGLKGIDKLEAMKQAFIDVRLFGGVFAVSKDNTSLTGPVQIAFGESLHMIQESEVGLTSVFSSSEDKGTGTMGTKHMVPYAAIITDGSINQFNAEKSSLSDADVERFVQALWSGTNELKTTSKNQNSLLFLNLVNKEEYGLFTVSNLRSLVRLKSDLQDTEIRSTKDFALDVTGLVAFVNEHAEKFEKVELIVHPSLRLIHVGEEVSRDDLEGLFAPHVEYKEVV